MLTGDLQWGNILLSKCKLNNGKSHLHRTLFYCCTFENFGFILYYELRSEIRYIDSDENPIGLLLVGAISLLGNCKSYHHKT
jgi:hypothetical protein